MPLARLRPELAEGEGEGPGGGASFATVCGWLADVVNAFADEDVPVTDALRRAAEAGWAPAAYDLGEVTARGERGVEADAAAAGVLFERAAAAGHARAMARLAEVRAGELDTEALCTAADAADRRAGRRAAEGPSASAAAVDAVGTVGAFRDVLAALATGTRRRTHPQQLGGRLAGERQRARVQP